MRWVCSPVAINHTRTVLSYEPDATILQSAEIATAQTECLCPSSFKVCLPVAVVHTRTVLSREPDATVLAVRRDRHGANCMLVPFELQLLRTPLLRYSREDVKVSVL